MIRRCWADLRTAVRVLCTRDFWAAFRTYWVDWWTDLATHPHDTAQLTWLTPLGPDGKPCGPTVEAEAVYDPIREQWRFVGDTSISAPGRTVAAMRIEAHGFSTVVQVG